MASENLDNLLPFCQKPFEIWTNSLEYECPYHLKTGPFEIRPSKSQDFKCFWISNGRISDPYFISIGHNKSVGKGLQKCRLGKTGYLESVSHV